MPTFVPLAEIMTVIALWGYGIWLINQQEQVALARLTVKRSRK